MAETIDLKVDRRLIDAKFESYYLTNQDTVLQSISPTNPINELTLEDKQLYSYLHFSAFSKDFNYLFTDPFDDRPVCYYIDSEFKVWQVTIDKDKDQFNQPIYLLDVPDVSNYKASDCLTTLSFPSQDIALISFSRCATKEHANGQLLFSVISTGNRKEKTTLWNTVDTFDLSNEASFGPCWRNDNQQSAMMLSCPAKLIESSYRAENDKNSLVVIIMTLFKNNAEKYECMLNILQLVQMKESSTWSISRLQQLAGPSYPSYVGFDFEEENMYLTIASGSLFKSTYDSSKNLPVQSNLTGQAINSDEEKGNVYVYHQNDSEITVDFKLAMDIESEQVRVNFGIDEVEIYVRDERVFKEKLWNEIKKEMCTWILDKSPKDCARNGTAILQITLTKKLENQAWNQLIKGKERGTELISPEESAAFQELSLLASNLSDFGKTESSSLYIPSLADCELCDEVSEDLILFRYNCTTRSLTHQAFLGGHQWLFYRKVDGKKLPCFALRHDIDALIWQPDASSNFKLEHIATFSALGYVQASKESKKFLNCSPGFDYAFIADSTNHVYIYKQPALCDGVRNRKEGIRPKIAKQKVVNLGSEFVKVLGSAAFKEYLLILSQRKIFLIKVNF